MGLKGSFRLFVPRQAAATIHVHLDHESPGLQEGVDLAWRTLLGSTRECDKGEVEVMGRGPWTGRGDRDCFTSSRGIPGGLLLLGVTNSLHFYDILTGGALSNVFTPFS